MGTRRNLRRAAAVLNQKRLVESDDNENPSDNDDFFQIFQNKLKKARKSTLPKNVSKRGGRNKKTRGRGTTRRGETRAAPRSAMSSINLESDFEIADDDEVEVINHQKHIENKVDLFFKSSNLLSDDEEEVAIVESTIDEPQKITKKFYSLSDSDEDTPITSTMNTSHKSQSEEQTCSTKNSKTNNDDLMEIVDKILDCNEASVQIDVEPDENWTDFKAKTETILGSVNALLDGFKEDKKEEKAVEEVVVVVQQSPEKVKPSCPICLEELGKEVVAASTICGHIFCQECIRKAAKISKCCPTCRKRINLKQIHPLYL